MQLHHTGFIIFHLKQPNRIFGANVRVTIHMQVHHISYVQCYVIENILLLFNIRVFVKK